MERGLECLTVSPYKTFTATNKNSYAWAECFAVDGARSSGLPVEVRGRSLNPERVRRQERQGQVCVSLGLLALVVAVAAIGSSAAIVWVFTALGTIGLIVACQKFLFVKSVLQRPQRK